MKIKGIYDNDGKTADRFTVVYDSFEGYQTNGKKLWYCVSMDGSPFHPQGIGMHCTTLLGRHLGKKITFEQLPIDCQKLVFQDLQEVA